MYTNQVFSCKIVVFHIISEGFVSVSVMYTCMHAFVCIYECMCAKFQDTMIVIVRHMEEKEKLM